MRCARCGADTRVAETRFRENQTTRRRRTCVDERCKHSSWTIEIHEAAAGGSRTNIVSHAETLRRRWAQLARDRIIAAELHKGWAALGKRFGLTKTSVYLAAHRGRWRPRP